MKAIKNYSILVISTITLIFSGCSLTGPKTNPADVIPVENDPVQIANPWEEVNKSDIENALGIKLIIPEDAENTVYRFNSELSLGEILFDYENNSFTYRMKKSAGNEDISGLYYDWTISSDENIKGYEGKSYRAITEEETVDLVTWVDPAQDITYSLSTSAPDLDGFDIIAIVERLIADENAEADMYDIDTIGKLLSLKYPYAPPFHLDFDHEEDGCYVFHFFEVVTNEDESHTATVDWFTVDPKTGETTTITGETFNIGFYAADGNVECAPGYLFDRFLHGEIDAKVYNPLNPLESEGWDTFDYKSINISDLNFEPEEWTYDAFYLGDMLDLDNDGEDEFILDGPYGGMYFDVLDGDLYVFAAATGNAGSLKYTYYEGDCWIVYHDTTHSGRLCYWLYKYEGADNLVDSMTLMGFMDSEDNTEYTFNGESITEGEFVMIHNEIFGVKNLE